jgi:t-SNARE complex subunit (syntaxin)
MNVQVIIEDIDEEKKTVLFKPYSTEFKNNIDFYPSYIADINMLSKDPSILKHQLLKIAHQHVERTLKEENPNLNSQTIDLLKSFQNEIIEADSENLPEIRKETIIEGKSFVEII